MHYIEQPPEEIGINDAIISYQEVVNRLRSDTWRTFPSPKDRPYIIPFPAKTPDRSATVTFDYAGDFSLDKDPFSYALRMLDLL